MRVSIFQGYINEIKELHQGSIAAAYDLLIFRHQELEGRSSYNNFYRFMVSHSLHSVHQRLSKKKQHKKRGKLVLRPRVEVDFHKQTSINVGGKDAVIVIFVCVFLDTSNKFVYYRLLQQKTMDCAINELKNIIDGLETKPEEIVIDNDPLFVEISKEHNKKTIKPGLLELGAECGVKSFRVNYKNSPWQKPHSESSGLILNRFQNQNFDSWNEVYKYLQRLEHESNMHYSSFGK